MSVHIARFRDYRRLRFKLTRNAVRNKLPLRGMFELTYECNHRCIHCYTVPAPDKKELTTAQVKSVLDQLKDAGCFYIGFTGGEIFTRPDMLDILYHAKKCAFQTILKTNGTLINKDMADHLAKLAINNVDLSLLGAKEETFDSITQVKGSFKRFVKTIDLLKERRIPLQLKTCVMKSNIDEFMDMKRFAKERGLRFSYDPALTPKSDGSRGPIDHRLSNEKILDLRKTLIARWKEKHKNDKNFKKQMNKSKAKKDFSTFFRCGVGRYTFTIGPYGHMKTCIDIPHPMADVLKKGVMGAWEETKKFIENFKPSEEYRCAVCDLNQYCSWCPARGFLEKGDLNRCSPFHKEMAILRAQEAGDGAAEKYIKEYIEKNKEEMILTES